MMAMCSSYILWVDLSLLFLDLCSCIVASPFWDITMVSEHNLCLAYGISAIMLSIIQEEGNMNREDKNKTPLFGLNEEGDV